MIVWMRRFEALASSALPLVLVWGCSPDGRETTGGTSSFSEALTYVGRERCSSCHPAEAAQWEGSHHDRAMEPVAPATVLGDFDDSSFQYAGVTSTFFERDGAFFIRTDGPGGELTEYEIAYTFGVDPLQQYLVAFPGGRYQVLPLAWDNRSDADGGQQWFHLHPDDAIDYEDPLHWTKRYQNWNSMCASCHSTGLRKNFDAGDNRYRTEWSEVDVSCEACHGPGSAHAAGDDVGSRPPLAVELRTDEPTWVMDMQTGLSRREPPRTEHGELETCAPCHSRRTQLGESDRPKHSLFDGFRPSVLRPGLYHPDGQIRDEVYVYGSFLQSKMYRQGVTCQDCHDPHSLSVRGGADEVCASCHLADRFDDPSHHFHEPGSAGASCVSCHMPETTYMVIDPRRDHSLRVPRPDLTVSAGAPNACNGCHESESPEWAARTLVEWTGREPGGHYGDALHAAWNGLPGARERLARVLNDPDAPAIVKASVATLVPSPTALSHDNPLIRLGGLEGVERLEATMKHQLLVPLLTDEVLAVRIEAVRILTGVPQARFTPDQRAAFGAALDEYRAVQRFNADWPESHVNLALVDVALGDLDAAEARYHRALELDPEFPSAYVNLADLMRVRGDNAAAESVLREGIAGAFEPSDIHHALGLTLVRLGRGEEGAEELRRAYELRPDVARYAYVYGVAIQSTDGVDPAVRFLTDASERHPYDPEILYALATMHRDRGRPDEALPFARRLSSIVPNDRSVRQLVVALEAASRD